MGATQSNNSSSRIHSKIHDDSPAGKAAAGMEEAMKRCNAALQYLKTSESVLTVKRNKAKSDALQAFQRQERSEAASLMRKANMAEADLQTIRRRQLAIERQRSMIEQQQLNTMLTSVLVETSAALHTANTSAIPEGDHPADAVDQAREKLEEVADMQAEVANSHADFDEVATAAGVTSKGAGIAAAAMGFDLHEAAEADPEAEYASELKQLETLAAAATASTGKPKPPAAPETPVPALNIPSVPAPNPQPKPKAAAAAPPIRSNVII